MRISVPVDVALDIAATSLQFGSLLASYSLAYSVAERNTKRVAPTHRKHDSHRPTCTAATGVGDGVAIGNALFSTTPLPSLIM